VNNDFLSCGMLFRRQIHPYMFEFQAILQDGSLAAASPVAVSSPKRHGVVGSCVLNEGNLELA